MPCFFITAVEASHVACISALFRHSNPIVLGLRTSTTHWPPAWASCSMPMWMAKDQGFSHSLRYRLPGASAGTLSRSMSGWMSPELNVRPPRKAKILSCSTSFL
jgi:hypothetical protein